MDVRGVARILPDLDDDLLVELFHKGARAQWTSRDLDFATPRTLSDRQARALARLLTPVYFGEQTAMAGASAILPQLMRARESSAQLYLASFIMDEARHFEALTRLYQSLKQDPLGLRDLPELLVYHHRLRQGDRLDWVWGILFSDLIAKHFYRSFGNAWGDPLLAGLSKRILQDESRHLAFAEHYLRRNLVHVPHGRRTQLLQMRDDLFRLLETMTERVRADAEALEIDADEYLGRVRADVDAFAARIGLSAPPEPPTAPPTRSRDTELSATETSPRTASNGTANTDPNANVPATARLSDCFGCLLTLFCGRGLALAR
jgi:hypothetical protein